MMYNESHQMFYITYMHQEMTKPQPFSITEAAVARLKELGEKKGKVPLLLRIEVKSGGCFGFKYVYDFDAQVEEGDFTLHMDGAVLFIDPLSLEKVQGSRLHYLETLGKAAFEIHNPQASSGCGCGNSFGIS
ncbi:MAG: iron-sulfur cluster assembly accessory protein [Proteobacteria bacterium]|nr:iron-sulfur cluster assembly accessory protein [Pseudomonadota bacterium]